MMKMMGDKAGTLVGKEFGSMKIKINDMFGLYRGTD